MDSPTEFEARTWYKGINFCYSAPDGTIISRLAKGNRGGYFDSA
jgi:hypothetical protein